MLESDTYSIFSAIADRLAPLYPGAAKPKNSMSERARLMAMGSSSATPMDRLCTEVTVGLASVYRQIRSIDRSSLHSS